jgi:hypothetical protein
MVFSHAVVLFAVVVLAVLGLDFALVSRRNTAVIAVVPAVLLAAFLLVLVARVAERTVEFAAIGAMVLSSALFGYANFLAFVKRGITFSILVNHARPPHERHPDADFIALEERIAEMRSHGWVEGDAAGWKLTDSGRRVVRLRRALLRALRIEAVG